MKKPLHVDVTVTDEAGDSLGVSRVIDKRAVVSNLFLSPDGRSVGGQSNADAGLKVLDLESLERWSVPRFRAGNALFANDGRLLVAGGDGAIRIYSPPTPLAATPGETKAWLEAQTSVELDEGTAPRMSCP